MPEQDFLLSVTPFAKKDKIFNFKTSHWVSRTIFWKRWQNHFQFLSRGPFWKKIFFAENLHYEDSNVFIEKITNFEKKNPTVLTKLLLMSTAKQCGKKIIFLKKTVRSRICYQLRAGILRQFSRGCFLHIQGYTSGRKCRPKKRLLTLFPKSNIKPTDFQRNFSTRISILHSSCSTTSFGNKFAQSFSDHKHFSCMFWNFSTGCYN